MLSKIIVKLVISSVAPEPRLGLDLARAFGQKARLVSFPQKARTWKICKNEPIWVGIQITRLIELNEMVLFKSEKFL